MILAMIEALPLIAIGFLVASLSIRISSAPARVSSPSSRPPTLATSAVAPAARSASATSMAVRSAPPAERWGMTCRIVLPVSAKG
jgi:hypothetical protein